MPKLRARFAGGNRPLDGIDPINVYCTTVAQDCDVVSGAPGAVTGGGSTDRRAKMQGEDPSAQGVQAIRFSSQPQPQRGRAGIYHRANHELECAVARGYRIRGRQSDIPRSMRS